MTRNWGWLVGLGVLSILVGTLAILMPFVSSIAVNAWIGALFLIAGVAALVHAWNDGGWKGRLAHVGIGLVYLIGGALVVLEPFAALFAFSIVVAAMMFVSGAWRLWEGVRMRPEAGWGWMTAAGALMVLLAVAIWFAFPGAAFWLLGTLAGVSFIVEGWALLFLGLDARRARKDDEGGGDGGGGRPEAQDAEPA
jgi:uncharacterized membrane protein HdeD (DUF308 family)